MDNNLAFPLTRLPFDVTEQILGRVECRGDLVSFAAASTACKELVIPRHTEYRVLRVGDRPEIWAHLHGRPDLARNIRHVTIRGAPPLKIYSKPERYPVSLVDTTVLRSDSPETVISNICQALRSMDSLRSFTWIAAWSPLGPYIDFPHYYNDVFQALKDSKSLVRFKIVDKMAPAAIFKPLEDEEYPLWHIGDLQSLSVRQLGWWPQGLNSLLLRSPNLQSLDIRLPNEGSHVLTSCHLPQLRRLNLNSTGSCGEKEIVDFLQTHPTIEDLRWYPHNDTLRLSHGSLPNLKSLITSPGIACSVLSDPTLPNRAIECISQLSLDEPTLAILDAIDTSQLRDIRVWRYAGLASIDHLAELFPHLTHLEIPKFGIPTRDDTENNNYTIDDYIHTLSKFRCLEYLIDSAIWPVLLLDEANINSLAIKCSSLKRLGFFDTQKSEYVDIVLSRNQGKVSWSQEAAEKEWQGI
ncbi:F-box domain-containing protein [Mycena venus]|uniref:F-box domain-containing protein n=1 Tax=Mycena venus TaxID=2733690 RepID=A0A8H6Y6P6_9AGAR|nr:F-box domain-containing protein [Mycena venus]